MKSAAADEPEGTDATVTAQNDDTIDASDMTKQESEQSPIPISSLFRVEHGQRRNIQVNTGVIPNTNAACKL